MHVLISLLQGAAVAAVCSIVFARLIVALAELVNAVERDIKLAMVLLAVCVAAGVGVGAAALVAVALGVYPK